MIKKDIRTYIPNGIQGYLNDLWHGDMLSFSYYDSDSSPYVANPLVILSGVDSEGNIEGCNLKICHTQFKYTDDITKKEIVKSNTLSEIMSFIRIHYLKEYYSFENGILEHNPRSKLFIYENIEKVFPSHYGLLRAYWRKYKILSMKNIICVRHLFKNTRVNDYNNIIEYVNSILRTPVKSINSKKNPLENL